VAKRTSRRWLGLPLLGLGFLGLLGFGVGAVVGGLWREPGLVLDFALGDAQRVEWGSDRGRAPLPDVGADGGGAEAPAPKPRERALLPEPMPEAPEAGHFAVQVGAFAESRVAEKLADKLRAKGYGVYVSPSVGTGAARWRVRVGPLGTRDLAENAASRLKSQETLPTWVLDEGEQ
jgi:hypothetical protein